MHAWRSISDKFEVLSLRQPTSAVSRTGVLGNNVFKGSSTQFIFCRSWNWFLSPQWWTIIIVPLSHSQNLKLSCWFNDGGGLKSQWFKFYVFQGRFQCKDKNIISRTRFKNNLRNSHLVYWRHWPFPNQRLKMFLHFWIFALFHP